MCTVHTADSSTYVAAFLAAISAAIKPTNYSAICATVKATISIAVSPTYSSPF